MNTDLDFYKWFETIAVKLEYREISFRKIFEYLDNQPTPIIIVETGSLREEGNFLSDGQSTLLFDKYTQFRGDNSKVYTVDINPNVTNLCKQIVSDKVDIITGDSVGYLNSFSKNFFLSLELFSLESIFVKKFSRIFFSRKFFSAKLIHSKVCPFRVYKQSATARKQQVQRHQMHPNYPTN